ncbi:MAG: hypothetical protein U9Q27_01835 [Patescibacteria group bacterium]|nr:hypothetical protein [Patescibacteria group bacterium]
MDTISSLSQPLFIRDKSVVGVLLPNTEESANALKQFMANLKLDKKEFDKWVKEIESPEANARYDAIVADADANDGWVDGEEFFKNKKDAEKRFF